MPRILLLVGTLVLLAGSGCVLPIPHFKQTCGPIEGAVFDAKTRRPLRSVCVSAHYPDGGELRTLTDETGRFCLPSKHRFHCGFMFGVALNYSLPYDCGWYNFNRVDLAREGYQLAYLELPREDLPPQARVATVSTEGHKVEAQPERIGGRGDLWHSSIRWRFAQVYMTPGTSSAE
jgi:hypothetical protein